jgi:CBS domain-containing protein
MQTVSQIMTRNVQAVSPGDTIRHAAQMMNDLDVGVLPVCDGERLVGMVTDRDIVVRATSAGIAPDKGVVNQVMSTDVRWCFEDQPLDEVMQQMADTQIRRIPVVSHDDGHKLIGIVSLGDIATKSQGEAGEVDQVVEEVSFPSEPDRSGQNAGAGQQSKQLAMGSNTGTASGLAGSDVENEIMDADPDASSTADPSNTGRLNAGKVATIDPSGPAASSPAGSDATHKRSQDDSILVRHVDRRGGDTSTGESGAPAGTDATGVSGGSGGMAGGAGSPGTGIGSKP